MLRHDLGNRLTSHQGPSEGNMAKRTIKGSERSFRAIKKQARARAAAENASVKNPKTLIGPEARREERFRELVAWYVLQGVDEATAQRRAHDEIDDDPRKD
jgi:hypothetical protein